MRSALRVAIGVAGSAALLAGAAIGRAPWHLCALFALAPFLYAIDGLRVRAALGAGLLLSIAFAAAAFHWFAPAVAQYSGGGAWVGWAALIVLAPFALQPQIALAAGMRAFAPARWAAIAFISTYIGMECALPKLFGDTLGYALLPSRALRQGAELGGGPLLTLLCLLCSESLAAALGAALRDRQPKRALRTLSIAGLAFGLVWMAGNLRADQIEARERAAPKLTIGVVQANITNYDKLAAERGTYDAVSEIIATHASLSRQLFAQGPLDLLIWPETVYPTTFGQPQSEEGAELDRAIAAVSGESRTPLVFGAFDRSVAGEHNALFLLQPGEHGLHAVSYRKALLFPLSERVPRWLDSPRARKALPWLGHFAAGIGPRTLPLSLRDGKVIQFAPLICFEALFAGYAAAEARDADLLLTLSNDSWFAGDQGPRLHLQMAAFRSIESRRPMVRATNSGVSALVLPSGAIVQPTPFGERTAQRLEVPLLPRASTAALALGDWVGACSLAVALLLLLWSVAPALGRGRSNKWATSSDERP